MATAIGDGVPLSHAAGSQAAANTVLTASGAGLDGCISSWPPSMEARYGFTSDQALGRIPSELLRTVFLRPRSEIAADLADIGSCAADVINHHADGKAVLTVTRWEYCSGAGSNAGWVTETHADSVPQALSQSRNLALQVTTVAHDLSEALTAASAYNFAMRNLLERMSPPPETLAGVATRQMDQIKRAALSLRVLREVVDRYRVATDPVADGHAEGPPAPETGDAVDSDVLTARAEWIGLDAEIKAIVDIPENAIRYREREALLAPLYERQHAIVDRLCAMHTRSMDSLKAVAQLILSMSDNIEDVWTDAGAYGDDQARMVFLLLRELAAATPNGGC